MANKIQKNIVRSLTRIDQNCDRIIGARDGQGPLSGDRKVFVLSSRVPEKGIGPILMFGHIFFDDVFRDTLQGLTGQGM